MATLLTSAKSIREAHPDGTLSGSRSALNFSGVNVHGVMTTSPYDVAGPSLVMRSPLPLTRVVSCPVAAVATPTSSDVATAAIIVCFILCLLRYVYGHLLPTFRPTIPNQLAIRV